MKPSTLIAALVAFAVGSVGGWIIIHRGDDASVLKPSIDRLGGEPITTTGGQGDNGQGDNRHFITGELNESSYINKSKIFDDKLSTQEIVERSVSAVGIVQGRRSRGTGFLVRQG